MLKQLWDQRQRTTSQFARNANETIENIGMLNPGLTTSRRHIANDDRTNQDNFDNTADFFGTSTMADSVSGGVSSIENYLLGSLMPGVAEFSTTDFSTQLGQEYHFMGGFQDWPMNAPGMIPRRHT